MLSFSLSGLKQSSSKKADDGTKAEASVFKPELIIDEKMFMLAIVRKKDKNHACLVVEGISEGKRCFWRSDLFLNLETTLSNLAK